MRKIIKQLSYDSDTARKCAEYSENVPGDTIYFIERLMFKKSGEFFLWVFGEKNTKYAKLGGSDWTEQELIIPLSLDAAQAWAEEHMDGTEYERLFGEVAEATETDKEVLSIHLKCNIARRVRQLAREQHRSISSVVEERLADI